MPTATGSGTGLGAPPDFVSFCREEQPRLVAALGVYLGAREVAEELVQEALLRASQRWSRVRHLQRPGAWVRHVAFNLARSQVRRWRAEQRAAARHGEVPPVHHDADGAEAAAVRAAVAALPERQRRALVLRAVVGLDVAAVAEEMNVSSAAVRSLTKRATAAVRVQLDAPPASGMPRARGESHDGEEADRAR
ncbi:MAG: RNA polymerase sigma factor [Nitriliruptoraceae bacterium]